MAGDAARRSWGPAVRYVVGGVLGLIAAVAVRAGAPWYVDLGVLATAVIFVVGRRRIFRPGITRTDDEIVCRYVPWYEGNAYLLDVVVPLMGVAAVGAGVAPGNPTWLLFTGWLFLILTSAFVFADLRIWRRYLLSISASALTVRLATGDATVLPRERVESITPKTVPNGVSGSSLQIEIAYRAVDSNSGDRLDTLLLIGPRWTVQPINLLDALLAWSAGAHEDPNQLINRIEHILRGGGSTRA
jgi:hypothetical protein